MSTQKEIPNLSRRWRSFAPVITGLTRTELNRRFLDNLDRSMKILEVGSNVGNQLLCLHVLKEIHRCTKKYIFGFEYYSDETKEIPYRGNSDLLWKADFAEKYIELFDDLTLVKEERIKYLGNENIDAMFLLKKKLLI